MPTPAPPVRADQEVGAALPKSNSHSTSALVVGIVGLFIFGIILGPVAIYLGSKSRREIESSQGQLTGSGKATAAIVLGAVATIVWAVTLIATLAAA